MLIKRGDRTIFSHLGNTQYTLGDFYYPGGDTGQYSLDVRVMQAIVVITIHYFIPKVRITSAYRSKAHDDELRARGIKVANSPQHRLGQALDFVFPKNIDTSKFNDGSLYEAFKRECLEKGPLYRTLYEQYGIRQFLFEGNHIHISTWGNLIVKELVESTNETQQAAKVEEDTSKVPASKEYYDYYHLDAAVKTIQALIDVQNSVIQTLSTHQKDLLEYKNELGVTNLDRLWELYDEDQKCKYSAQYKSLVDAKADVETKQKVKLTYVEGTDYEIMPGTLLMVPKNKASVETLSAQGKDLFMKQQDLKCYLYDSFQAIMNDPTYVPTQRVKIRSSSYSVNYLNISFSCWIYVRALDKILNVTPFVRSMDTTVADGGGSFTINLNDISDINNLRKYSETYYTYVQKVMGGSLATSYFKKILQQNDIVFLRYERLDIEGQSDEHDQGKVDLVIPDSSLPGKIYDMIGLLDHTSENYEPRANISLLNLSGRDFTKLIVEDGSYFFPFALQNGGKEFFLNYNPADSVFKRLFVSGQFMTLFTALHRSIRDSIGFIFNQLTNTGVLPKENDLFDAYKNAKNWITGEVGDQQSHAYAISSANKEYLDSIEQNGVWKIIKVIVDNQLDERRLNNGELSTPEGTIMDLLRRICMEPFVEFWGDTLGDQFVFMARQPPFTREQIKNFFDTNPGVISIEADQVGGFNINWENTYYTWYKLEPLGGLFGSGQWDAGTRMPVVYFEEYANLFGMHKKVVPDSYIPLGAISGNKEKSNVEIFRSAMAEDLKFIIESNAILPFTRRGTIVLNGGDRRVKKGMWIDFKPTGEIFYVRGVANSVSITGNVLSRTTTLDVERGMLKKYVLGPSDKQINGKDVNYFNIVNMDVIMSSLNAGLTGETTKDVIPTAPTLQQMSNSYKLFGPDSFKLFYSLTKNIDLSSNTQLIDTEMFDFFAKRKQLW